MNRGIARRTLFENAGDMRFFLTCLARQVRAGGLELHAWCLLPTHFHLLVRSPAGRLAEAMCRVQTAYSRRFNRTRRRDGPLVRGRYRSKPVECTQYRWVLVAYIDANPVVAGLAEHASDYAWGSAWHYARAHGPRWMDRTWVESVVRRAWGPDAYDPRRYSGTFHGSAGAELFPVIEARLAHRGRQEPLIDLLGASSPEISAWMRRKALLADGTTPGLPLATPEGVERAVTRVAGALADDWTVGGSGFRSGWRVLRVATLSLLCGLRQEEIAARLGCARSVVSTTLALHRRLVMQDGPYVERLAAVTRTCLARYVSPPR